jgi:2-oxoisovalerate dehydrogenase E2 component (dihydrolipoyl transacylase)
MNNDKQPEQPKQPKQCELQSQNKTVTEKIKTKEVKGLMRSMIKTMEASNEVPQFGYSDEFVLNNLVKVKHNMKNISISKNVKLSYMAFFIKSASLALHEFPILNSRLSSDKTEIIFNYEHNIGTFHFSHKRYLHHLFIPI